MSIRTLLIQQLGDELTKVNGAFGVTPETRVVVVDLDEFPEEHRDFAMSLVSHREKLLEQIHMIQAREERAIARHSESSPVCAATTTSTVSWCKCGQMEIHWCGGCTDGYLYVLGLAGGCEHMIEAERIFGQAAR